MSSPCHNKLPGSPAVQALKKLLRQLSQLERSEDVRLRARIRRSLPRIRGLVPGSHWVSERELVNLCEPVSQILQEYVQQEAATIREQWKTLLRDDIVRQRTFVKARADAQLQYEKQMPCINNTRDSGPAHPSLVVRAQAQEWLSKWSATPCPNLDAIDAVLQKVPQILQACINIQFDAASLRAIASSLANQAPGPDTWKADGFSFVATCLGSRPSSSIMASC